MAKRKQRKKNKSKDINELISDFNRTVYGGPKYTCTSCKKLWYKHSLSRFEVTFANNYSEKVANIIIQCPRIKSINDRIWICNTCKTYIKKGKIPPTSVMNLMTFPYQEILKDLTPLEQTLVSVILPFMKIHQEPRGRQKFIQGNMVLVPGNVCQIVTQLPRLTTETATIKATLKRRLKYKHHVYCLNIRPQLVIEAAKLLSDSPLYKEHNVDINNDWEDMYNETSLETDTTEEDLVISEQEQLNQNPKKNDISNNDQMKNANYASDDEDDKWS